MVTVSLPVVVIPEDPGAPALEADRRPEVEAGRLKRFGCGYRKDAVPQM